MTVLAPGRDPTLPSPVRVRVRVRLRARTRVAGRGRTHLRIGLVAVHDRTLLDRTPAHDRVLSRRQTVVVVVVVAVHGPTRPTPVRGLRGPGRTLVPPHAHAQGQGQDQGRTVVGPHRLLALLRLGLRVAVVCTRTHHHHYHHHLRLGVDLRLVQGLEIVASPHLLVGPYPLDLVLPGVQICGSQIANVVPTLHN